MRSWRPAGWLILRVHQPQQLCLTWASLRTWLEGRTIRWLKPPLLLRPLARRVTLLLRQEPGRRRLLLLLLPQLAERVLLLLPLRHSTLASTAPLSTLSSFLPRLTLCKRCFFRKLERSAMCVLRCLMLRYCRQMALEA